MNIFDKKTDIKGNQFVKSDKRILKSMFGNSDLQPLWIADMDFEVAPCITQALTNVVSRGVYAYEFHPDRLYQVMVDWYIRRHDLILDAECFLYTPSVLSAIAIIIDEFTSKKDSILIQTPVYHMFADLIGKADRVMVDSPLRLEKESYEMDFDDLERKIVSEGIKMMILCNPHNPVGRVWRKEELEKLVDVLGRHDVLLVSDEIHSDIIFDGHHFNSTSTIEYENQIVLLGSPAKTFGMQGFANGFIYSVSKTYRKRLQKTTQRLAIDPGTTLTAHATLAAYDAGEEWLIDLLTYLQITVKWINEFLEIELPEVKIIQPEGTYLLWIDFRSLNLSKEALEKMIVEDAKLALGKGEMFGGTGFMRMTIASPLIKIQTAFFQLKNAIKNLN
jgi:cystathionine beta-lyase